MDSKDLIKRPTWRNTFNSDFKKWGTLSDAWYAAVAAGYPYVAYNREIYRVYNFELITKNRAMTIEDLEENTNEKA